MREEPILYMGKVELCPRCKSTARLKRGMSYYKWMPMVECTSPRCRIRMMGEPYGNNGTVRFTETSFDGEVNAFTDLLRRWNERHDDYEGLGA